MLMHDSPTRNFRVSVGLPTCLVIRSAIQPSASTCINTHPTTASRLPSRGLAVADQQRVPTLDTPECTGPGPQSTSTTLATKTAGLRSPNRRRRRRRRPPLLPPPPAVYCNFGNFDNYGAPRRVYDPGAATANGARRGGGG